jgi:hypothetical protein
MIRGDLQYKFFAPLTKQLGKNRWVPFASVEPQMPSCVHLSLRQSNSNSNRLCLSVCLSHFVSYRIIKYLLTRSRYHTRYFILIFRLYFRVSHIIFKLSRLPLNSSSSCVQCSCVCGNAKFCIAYITFLILD